MSLWLEAAGSALFASSGALLGYLFSRLSKPYWMLGYFLPLTVILIYRLVLIFPVLAFLPPASWLMMGLTKFALLGFVATMVLTTPLSRLPQKRSRILVVGLMVVFVFVQSVWPFLAPIFNRHQLEQLQTSVGRDGVCRQTTGYTCGPAAAVTALRKLGLPGEEGEIAIRSHTSSSTGTPPDLLAEALRNEYRTNGLIAEYRAFKNMAELK